MSDQPTLAGVPSEGTDLPTVCVLCSHNCGIRVDVREGRIVEVRADESNPISKGYICNKAFSIPAYVDHGQRVRHPEEQATGDEDPEGAAAHEEEQPGDEHERRGRERGAEPSSHEGARRHGRGHAGEPEGAGEEADLPVGHPLRPGDLRQERVEAPEPERIAEEQDGEQPDPGPQKGAARAPHLKERSVHHG